MASLSVDYMLREAFGNLRRNVLMTVATIITVAVSLSLVGGALLLRQGVANATYQWRGGVELSIFMRPTASPSQSEAVESELAKMPEVKKIVYVDQTEAHKEFSRMFADTPELVETVAVKDLPPSYRVVPKKAEYAEIIGERFKKREGVRNVAYAKDVVKKLLDITRILQGMVFGIAVVLLVSASLLIFNTIRMAIFARRREVAVMKLVGATNWFIRVPFMLEGLVAGLSGAALAFGSMFFVRLLVRSIVNDYGIFDQVVVSSSDVIGTGIALVLVGALVGTLGSALAVRRFLNV